jgi:hypothetical protein
MEQQAQCIIGATHHVVPLFDNRIYRSGRAISVTAAAE